MARERIDIVVDEQVLQRNAEKRALLGAAEQLAKPARVPVLLNANQWCIQTWRGARISEYLAGPRENLRCQLLNIKWRAENLSVLDDQPIPTGSVSIGPDLGSPRGTEFAMQWDWPVDQPLKCRHMLTEPEQIDALTVPEPDGGLNATLIDWYRQMQQMADDFELRVNGQPVAIRITIGHGGGPIPSAFALAGENLFLWMAAEPQRVHRLMSIATESHLRCVDYFAELAGRSRGGPVWMGADSAEMVGPEMFRQFVVPYYLRVWEQHPGPRHFHMCGKIDHLLEILRDELAITQLAGFGFPVAAERLGEAMAGRVVLRGGMSPMLLHDGTVERIQEETRRYVRCLGATGGFIFYLGGSMVPGTSREKIEAMVRAAAEASSELASDYAAADRP